MVAGVDATPLPRDAALPMAEFLHPVSLGSMGLMALNDHVLKGAGVLPGWLTGKLSDVLGLIFFPLFLTALIDTVLFGLDRLSSLSSPLLVTGALGWRLSRAKLIASLLFTGIAFSALQLSPLALEIYAAFHRLWGIQVHVIQDPTDLLALPALAIAYLVGARGLPR